MLTFALFFIETFFLQCEHFIFTQNEQLSKFSLDISLQITWTRQGLMMRFMERQNVLEIETPVKLSQSAMDFPNNSPRGKKDLSL